MRRKRYLESLRRLYKELEKVNREAYYLGAERDIPKQVAHESQQWVVVAQGAVSAAYVLVAKE